MIAIALFFAVCGQPQTIAKAFTGLHPALQVDGARAARLFDKGYQDADKYKDLGPAYDPFFRWSARSTMMLYPLSYQAYEAGFQAKKQYLPTEQIESLRKSYVDRPQMDSVVVYGDLAAAPEYAQATWYGNQQQFLLHGVRVVMKVGSKVYEPRVQPGDLIAEHNVEDYTDSDPGPAIGITIGKPVKDRKDGHDRDDEDNQPQLVHHHDEWMKTSYQAEFDLFNSDGSPRITPADKDITFVVIEGDLQKKFKFQTDGLLKLDTMRPHKSLFGG